VIKKDDTPKNSYWQKEKGYKYWQGYEGKKNPYTHSMGM
jgi:hypothetical protein